MGRHNTTPEALHKFIFDRIGDTYANQWRIMIFKDKRYAEEFAKEEELFNHDIIEANADLIREICIQARKFFNVIPHEEECKTWQCIMMYKIQ